MIAHPLALWHWCASPSTATSTCQSMRLPHLQRIRGAQSNERRHLAGGGVALNLVEVAAEQDARHSDPYCCSSRPHPGGHHAPSCPSRYLDTRICVLVHSSRDAKKGRCKEGSMQRRVHATKGPCNEGSMQRSVHATKGTSTEGRCNEASTQWKSCTCNTRFPCV